MSRPADPMAEYTVVVDIGQVDRDKVDTTHFDQYFGHLRTGTSTEVVVTLPAAGLLQAVTTALAVVTVSGHRPRAVRALPAADFAAREEFAPGCTRLDPAIPTVTVEQAAALLGTSTQAVTKRLRGGALPGTKDGRDWRVVKQAVDEEVDRWYESTGREQRQVALDAMRQTLAVRLDSTDADLIRTGRQAVTSHRKFRPDRQRRAWLPVAADAVDQAVAAALEECRQSR